MALIRAWNTQKRQWQDVPAHYVGGSLFPGVFVREENAPKPERPERTKSPRRTAGTADTPATDEAANATTSTPPAGDPKKE